MSSNVDVKDGGNRDQFKSKFGFVLAAAGSAVGLGNLWRFPHVAGSNGGGAFVFVYLLCIVLIGGTALLVELMIGRNAKRNVIDAYGSFGKTFRVFGYLALIAIMLLLSFYAIIGGWTIFYLIKAISGNLIGLEPEALGGVLGGFFSSTPQLLFYQVIFLALTGGIIARGISGGIEKAAKILMPALFVMLVVLAARSVTLPGAMEGIKWYLTPDFSKITSDVIVSALGQAFFTLSLGVGGMLTYGSYLSHKENLGVTTVQVTIADTLVALLAGLIILPAVFAFGLDSSAGPTLVFITLPHVFGQMAGGTIFAAIFFLLLLVAALTSSIGMLEVATTVAVEKTKLGRVKSTVFLAIAAVVIGIPPLMSFGPWSDVMFRGKNLFDMYDFFVSNFTMPLVGFISAVLVGWKWSKEEFTKEFTSDGAFSSGKVNAIRGWIKFVVPVLVMLVVIQMLSTF